MNGHRSTPTRALHEWTVFLGVALLVGPSLPLVTRADEPGAPPTSPTDVAAGPVAEEGNKGAASAEQGDAAASSPDPVELPVYVPPPRGQTGSRVGAATRGAPPESRPQALAPAHVGLTSRAAPVLYWGVPNDVVGLVRITLAEESSPVDLLEIQAADGPTAGIYALDLAAHGVTLEVGKTYQWVTTLIPDSDRPWKDRESFAAISRVEPDAALERDLAAAPPDVAYRAYAKNGMWFDAIQDLSARIAQTPGDPALYKARASLLEQVKRGDLAVLDRAAAAAR